MILSHVFRSSQYNTFYTSYISYLLIDHLINILSLRIIAGILKKPRNLGDKSLFLVAFYFVRKYFLFLFISFNIYSGFLHSFWHLFLLHILLLFIFNSQFFNIVLANHKNISIKSVVKRFKRV